MFRVYDSEWKDGEDWRREYLEVAEVEKLAGKMLQGERWPLNCMLKLGIEKFFME